MPSPSVTKIGGVYLWALDDFSKRFGFPTPKDAAEYLDSIMVPTVVIGEREYLNAHSLETSLFVLLGNHGGKSREKGPLTPEEMERIENPTPEDLMRMEISAVIYGAAEWSMIKKRLWSRWSTFFKEYNGKRKVKAFQLDRKSYAPPTRKKRQ